MSESKIVTPKMLVAPWVPDALSLLDDESAYKIHVDFQSSPLRLQILDIWSNFELLDPGDTTVVDYRWDEIVVDSKKLIAPYDETDLHLVDGHVPTFYMDSPGVHKVDYIVILRESSGNPSPPSFPTLVDIDKVGPNQGQRGGRLQFSAEIRDEGVTDDYLNDPLNNDRVVATVPRWADMRLMDVVEGYLTLLPFRRPSPKRARRFDVVARTVITQAHKDGDPVELIFEGDVLRSKANAEYNANYWLIDRAGRESGPSLTSPILINLTPSPSELRPVDIPQLNDGLITLSDARAPGGVYMNILEVFDAAPGDILQPFWNFLPLDPITITVIQVWPISVPINYPTLASGGFEFTPGTIRAHYTWRRGLNPDRPSLPRFAPVDLTVAGPVSPDNPDPINRLLDVVTVKGQDGDNLLTINDRNQPARVLITLYANPVPGEVLELMWHIHPAPVAAYTVQPGDTGGMEIELFVDWLFIEHLGGVISTFYWTFNGVNRQRAPDTLVTVNLTPIVGLKDLEYVGVNYGPGPDSGFISCPLRPWVNGVGVKIPGDVDLLSEGDEVRLSWSSYANPNGNTSGVFPETIETFCHTLSVAEARDGYIFQVPFDPFILLPGLVKPLDGQVNPRHGSAIAQYRLIKAGAGGMGDSARRLVFITLIRPAGLAPCISDD